MKVVVARKGAFELVPGQTACAGADIRCQKGGDGEGFWVGDGVESVRKTHTSLLWKEEKHHPWAYNISCIPKIVLFLYFPKKFFFRTEVEPISL